MTDHDNLRYTLAEAKTCVHEGQPHRAIEYLKSVQSEIDDLNGDPVWAEHELIYACALAAMNQVSAESAFEEALKRIETLIQPDFGLTMRAHADYAKYLAGRGRREASRARNYYHKAERIAESLGREECVAHYQMCAIRIALEEGNSPQLRAFQRLQEAAKDRSTEVQQREAWFHYTEELEGCDPHLKATRMGAEADVSYFRGVLNEIRRGRK